MLSTPPRARTTLSGWYATPTQPALTRVHRAFVRASHGLPKLLDAPKRPALIGRVCNLNRTTHEPAWPAWPMPMGETCVTVLDALKRPRVVASLRPGSRNRRAPANVLSSWNLTLFVVGCGVLFAAFTFRERLREDALALGTVLGTVGATLLEQAREVAPAQVEAVERFVQSAVEAVRGSSRSTTARPVYTPAAVVDDD